MLTWKPIMATHRKMVKPLEECDTIFAQRGVLFHRRWIVHEIELMR
jgi:hypothetical protein